METRKRKHFLNALICTFLSLENNYNFTNYDFFYNLDYRQPDTVYQFLRSKILKKGSDNLIKLLITTYEFTPLDSTNMNKVKLKYLKQYLQKFKYYYLLFYSRNNNDVYYSSRKKTNKEINQLAIKFLFIVASM